MTRQKGAYAKERSGKNSRNRRKSTGRGGQDFASFWRQDVEQPRVCQYCGNTFWCLEQSRRKYCDPTHERKLYMFRRQALVDAAYDLLRWRGVLRQWVEGMVDSCHDIVLAALKALGCVWNEERRKCQWVETRRSA